MQKTNYQINTIQKYYWGGTKEVFSFMCRYNPEFQSTFSRMTKKISRRIKAVFFYVANLKTYFTTYPTTYFNIQKCIPHTTTGCGFAKQKCILARISRDKSQDILFSSILPFFLKRKIYLNTFFNNFLI